MDEVFGCPGCGAEIEYLSAVCDGCGMQLDWGEAEGLEVRAGDYVVCERCHKEILCTAKFCPECGEPRLLNGLAGDGSARVLPKCPRCGSEMDYGATRCDDCGAEVTWESRSKMLVDFAAFAEKEVIPKRNLDRIVTQYPKVRVHWDSFTYELETRGRRLDAPKVYKAPQVHYNSYGMYSE